MSDTWNAIQEVKSKQSSMRAKMLERKRLREGLVAELVQNDLNIPSSSPSSKPASRSASPSPATAVTTVPAAKLDTSDVDVERRLLSVLSDIDFDTSADSAVLTNMITKELNRDVTTAIVEHFLEKFAAQQLIKITKTSGPEKTNIIITSLDHTKILGVATALMGGRKPDDVIEGLKRKRDTASPHRDETSSSTKQSRSGNGEAKNSIESLLSMQSAKERENKKQNDEILNLLSQPTAKEQSLVKQFKSQGGQLKEFCPYGTKEECERANSGECKKLHFRKIIENHTDEALGDCSFLNTCFHMDTCKYVHYEVDFPKSQLKLDTVNKETNVSKSMGDADSTLTMFPPQWVQCDLRNFDMATLGKCAVVMADPPWDIHMELPYGTMSDDEMRKLPIPILQDDGYIFLWVTGRAMELGRECLQLWGYKRADEIIWVKTNQLQRIIRTGRTGHWLNHGKEHCLVGVKGNPKGVNKGLDCDVIVAEVRATSHKPDEIYGIIERLSPGTRKIEIFGRPHNVQPNWITLGNQVEGVKLLDPDIVKRFKERYPDGDCMKPAPHT